MPLIMRQRNESAVYFQQLIDPRRGQKFLAECRQRTGLRATWTHLLLYALAKTLAQWPRLNRFTAGGRLWARRGIWLSFSAKKAKAHDSPVVVIKKRIDPSWSFEELVRAIDSGVSDGRSEKRSRTDKELGLLFTIPHFLARWIARLLMWLGRAGALPRGMIDGDPLFASAFLANLGSIEMEPAHHHLYEYGNIPIFIVAGRIQDHVIAEDGTAAVVPRLPLKYTFDERIEDGLYCAAALDALRDFLESPPSQDS